jgi:hypothetical protein
LPFVIHVGQDAPTRRMTAARRYLSDTSMAELYPTN